MSDQEKLQKMAFGIAAWISNNIPKIKKQIKGSFVQVHEGNVYLWFPLEGWDDVHTNENEAMITSAWVQLQEYFKIYPHLFIQTNN